MDPTDVWYVVSIRAGREIWASTKRDFSITRKEIIEYFGRLAGATKTAIPKYWIFNAFGPLAVRFFRDENGNGRLDTREELSGAMFHTTAENEAEWKRRPTKPINLVPSHGCIHMAPKDRDTLIGMKIFRAGRKLIIHGYNDRYGDTK